MDIYTQIIEFGKKNKGLDEKDKNEKNKIYGCASSAWVKTEKQNNMFLMFVAANLHCGCPWGPQKDSTAAFPAP